MTNNTQMILPLVSLKSLFKMSIKAIIHNIDGNNINIKNMIKWIKESDKSVIGIGLKIGIKIQKNRKNSVDFTILKILYFLVIKVLYSLP